MLKFLRNLLAVLIGLTIFFGFGILILIGIGAASGDKEVEVKENSVLKLKLNKQIVETASNSPFDELDIPMPLGGDAGKIGLLQIIQNIEKAKNDDNIKGIYLELTQVGGGFASVQAIREKLEDFKASGKFIIAYGEFMSEKAYYLASVADKKYLFPTGAMEFNGLSSERMFYKGTFEKLEIKPEIFKVGDFKSAVEPFILDKMSDYSRQQTESFLNSLQDYYFQNVSKSIGKSVEELALISDSMFVRNAQDAVKYGLIDELVYEDQVFDDIKKRLEIEGDDKINFVGFGKYSKVKEDFESSFKKDKIAVIIAEGEIQSGNSEDGVMGSASVVRDIRKARLDDKVKAVVLRVNSPGGSALASDVMWREVMLTKKVKPIIASMSDVAASGGYFISMACDTIVAYPNTITGSIGVFGMWFDLTNFLKNKLGITTDRVKTGEFADLGSVNRPLTDYERAAIQQQVEETYDDFTKKAAQGRGMTQDELKKYASGRVWSGTEALEVGLVDVLGGLNEATEIAAKSAGLDSNYVVKYYPEKKDFFEELMKELSGETEAYFTDKQFGELKTYTKQFEELQRMKGIQAKMPFDGKSVE